MRVLLSTFGSRGDVEPLVALAVRLRESGAEVTVCAPPDGDFVERLAGVGVPLVGVGPSARALTKAAPPPSSMSERAARIIANIFDTVLPAAEGCDVLVATGMVPAAAAGLSVAEKLGIPSVSVTFQQLTLPSPRRRPLEYAGRPHPPEITGNQALWDLDAQIINELFGPGLNAGRAAHGLPPVVNVRSYVIGERPWLATDPILDPTDLDVVQTGSWLLPDERPLPDDLRAFLGDGEPPVYAGFGSMPLNAAPDLAQGTIDAIRAQGRRAIVSRGWADLEPDGCFLVGEVNHQALFRRVAAVIHHGGQGTTTTATLAGAPQVVVPQLADQPYWAVRVAALGIGVAVDATSSLSAALETALTPEIRARATEVSGMIRTDGAEAAAKLLLSA